MAVRAFDAFTWLSSTTNDSARATIEYRLLRSGLMEIQWADLGNTEVGSEGGCSWKGAACGS
jgi:hypothetical protein